MSLYFTNRRTALYGDFRNYTKEDLTRAIERLGGSVDPVITPETDNIIVGWYVNDVDLWKLDVEYPHKFVIVESNINDMLVDVHLPSGKITDLMWGGEDADLIGKFD